jgi:hypothetical protein
MAGPLAGISAAQVAQQKLPDQAAQQAKAGPSKFDQSLKSQGPEGVQKTGHVQQANQVQKMDQARQIEQAQKTQKADLGKQNTLEKNVTGKGMDPVTQKSEVSKSGSMISSMMANLEKGQSHIDKMINGGLSGKSMSNQELLSLQAGMYKYTQELDLVSKVVEKATSGLKDTLKTQV